ncbi:MAG: ATP-binding protein [Planctomycetia bacterium]|nr:ATP-binding protein [Planctomycetia bacterium]
MTVAIDLERMLRRLHLPTVRRLYSELECRAEKEGMSYRDYLEILIAEEVAHRAQTRIERSVRRARFPFLATIEDFDFTFQTSIRQQLLGSYLGPELVSEARSVVFLGPSGTGKTHLAISIAYRAIQNGCEALFVDADHLLQKLSRAGEVGSLRDVLPQYVEPDVLVIDEVGYLSHRPDAANVLFQVVNERYLKRRPMVFTTNKPPASWGRVLHDSDLAEAILDRVLERGRLIELRGPSYRRRHIPGRADEPQRGEAEGAPPPPAKEEGRKRRDGQPFGRRAGFAQPEPVRISGKRRSEFLEPTALRRETDVTREYQSDSSSKRPVSSAPFASLSKKRQRPR